MIEVKKESKTEFLKRGVDDADLIELIPDKAERLAYLSKLYSGGSPVQITQKGQRGLRGEPGKPGKDGYTPIKGQDYFDGKDGKPGQDGKPGKDGKPGRDGKIITEVIYNEDAEEVARSLEELPEKKKLDPYKALKDFSEILSKSRSVVYMGGGGGSTVVSTGSSPATSGEYIGFEVTQATHGLSALDAVYHNGSGWAKAQADSEDTLATHLVIEVGDTNTFTLAQAGKVTIASHGLTPGSYYYVSSASAGALTDTQPDVYSNPIILAIDDDTLIVLPFRASATQTDELVTLDGIQTVTNKTLTAPTITSPTMTLKDTTPTVTASFGYDQTNAYLNLGLGSSTSQILMGEWKPWSPTVNNVTLGTGGTVTGSYTVLGKFCYYKLKIQLGSSGQAISGAVTFDKPLTGKFNGFHIEGNAIFDDAGNAAYLGLCLGSTTTISRLTTFTVVSSRVRDANLSSTVPFTWGANDAMYAEGNYELA